MSIVEIGFCHWRRNKKEKNRNAFSFYKQCKQQNIEPKRKNKKQTKAKHTTKTLTTTNIVSYTFSAPPKEPHLIYISGYICDAWKLFSAIYIYLLLVFMVYKQQQHLRR